MVPHTPLILTSARPIHGRGPARVRYAYVQTKNEKMKKQKMKKWNEKMKKQKIKKWKNKKWKNEKTKKWKNEKTKNEKTKNEKTKNEKTKNEKIKKQKMHTFDIGAQGLVQRKLVKCIVNNLNVLLPNKHLK